MSEKVVYNLKLPVDIIEKFKKIAEENGRSIDEEISEIISEYAKKVM
ncbi:MAG: Arc family DNA-binding protein [Oscillospiraceae bacterium]|nr:Arc family DNA-binding protein [Oscillospiraceae bacterium]